ncbi:MAG: SAM-dependent methyltransferase [Planctomycetota bacterium]
MATTFEQTDWYDLPALYDIVFDVDTQREGEFLEAMQARFGGTRGKRVLEPACGSGRLVCEMTRRGWKVHGTDLNANMIAYTRKRLAREELQATLSQADMSAPLAASTRYDLAHCLVSTFKYLTTEDSARAHLRSVAAALKPGGLYVLGFHLSDYHDDRITRERWVEKRDGQHVVCNIQSWPPDRATRIEKVRSRLTVTERGKKRRSETHWDFRSYNASEVRSLLAAVPELELLTTFDFTYNLKAERELSDAQLDSVLILRRR